MKFIICLLFGHKRYRPKVFNNYSFITIRDSIGEDLYHINICERCGLVFSEPALTRINEKDSNKEL